MSTALPIVLPAQPAPRRRDPLLIGGWRAGLTRFMSVVLFVTFIGGPTAILRACEDDPGECEGDFDMGPDQDDSGSPGAGAVEFEILSARHGPRYLPTKS